MVDKISHYLMRRAAVYYKKNY